MEKKLEQLLTIVKDIEFAAKTLVQEGVLYICKKDIEELLMQDERIQSVQLDIAKPGDATRIIPVKDVVEPRYNIDLPQFPGCIDKIEEVGYGKTFILQNAAIVTTGPIVGFQEGIIDMSGPLAEYTPFSKTYNLVLHITKKEGIDLHEHEEIVRLAGLRAASGLARLCFENQSDKKYDEKKIYAFDIHPETASLPRVGYVYQCIAQGLLHDTYYYGRDSKLMLPVPINPFEGFMGAIVSGHCVSAGSKTTTYHHQNNAVLMECLERHGKEINFVGAVLSPMATTLEEKIRNAMITAKLMENYQVEGVIQSQEGFGNPTTDLMMICKNLERKGIKTVLISNEDAGVDGLSESLPDGVEEATAIVSTGNSNARIHIPAMNKTLGDIHALERITGGFVGSIQEDGSLIVEIHGIIGSHNLQGYSFLSAVTY